MARTTTMSATDFKKHCLAVLSDIANRKLASVVITKRGKPIARLGPTPEAEAPALFGYMKGSVTVPEGLDLSEVDVEEILEARQGVIHK